MFKITPFQVTTGPIEKKSEMRRPFYLHHSPMLLLLHLEAKSKESSSVCDVQCVSLDLNTSPFLSTIEQGDSVAQYKGEN